MSFIIFKNDFENIEGLCVPNTKMIKNLGEEFLAFRFCYRNSPCSWGISPSFSLLLTVDLPHFRHHSRPMGQNSEHNQASPLRACSLPFVRGGARGCLQAILPVIGL